MEFITSNIKKQLQINIKLGLVLPIKVVCRSKSRNSTSFEIFDENNKSMGVQSFDSTMCPIPGSFNRRLVGELNILLEEYKVQIDYDAFLEISKLAVSRCENLYGNGHEEWDCLIIIN